MESELQQLGKLVEKLRGCCSDSERIHILNQEPLILQCLEKAEELHPFFSNTDDELIIKSLIAVGQAELFLPLGSNAEKLKAMLEDLIPVEAFYKEMGGIVGYHWTMLSFLSTLDGAADIVNDSHSISYSRPPGIDLSSQGPAVDTFILEGILSMPFFAEMYPVGGAADRLKLCDPETGQSLPSAKLRFCGYTLLERLIRDVQAREYLYYKLFGDQIVTPIAMMTSFEKDNHRHILELCEQHHWFGRPRDSFRLFCQPAVPTMDRNGKWCVCGKMKLLMKPGGHGVIWKVAKQEGIFDWLESLDRKKILVRQINNPIAGIDHGLLSFCGVGFHDDEIFGFASCPRQVGSAEGINVLIERKDPEKTHYCLTSIEYCDFHKFSIEDVPVEKGSDYSQFPSNTNILFADIATVSETVERCPIPGMLVNLKKTSFTDDEGVVHEQEVARLESTMQNLADCFDQEMDSTPLKTYLTYNDRQKTISTIKKPFQEGGSLLETPEGCLYDFLRNAYGLLTNHCRVRVPEVACIESFVDEGPSFLFNYHPALGPLFSIIGQKIRGGIFHLYSELKLEITEVNIENLTLSGSLHVIAECPIGEGGEVLRYSDRIGGLFLQNVTVENRGYNPMAKNVYWKEEIERHELCEILIHGDGEFVAKDVVLRGNMRIEVDAGCRVTAFEENGSVQFKTEPLKEPIRRWIYHLTDDGSIHLEG